MRAHAQIIWLIHYNIKFSEGELSRNNLIYFNPDSFLLFVDGSLKILLGYLSQELCKFYILIVCLKKTFRKMLQLRISSVKVSSLSFPPLQHP